MTESDGFCVCVNLSSGEVSVGGATGTLLDRQEA